MDPLCQTRSRSARGVVNAAALVLVLAACAGKPSPPVAAPSPATIERPGAATVVVGGEARDATIVLGRAQQLEVRLLLEGNTDVDWNLAAPRPLNLQLQGERFERATRDRFYDESPGWRIWTFRPTQPGIYRLEFEKRVPRVVGPPLEVVRFTVRVS